jgi:hypothetical protein
MLRKSLVLALCLLAFTAMAWANAGPLHRATSLASLGFHPTYSGSSRSTLDVQRNDSLYYDDGEAQTIYGVTGQYDRVKYQAPAAFLLQSVYFYALNTYTAAQPCSVRVYQCNTNGSQGALLSGVRTTTVINYGSGWNDIDLTTPVQLTRGQLFYVVVGPLAGGTASGTCEIICDAAPSDGLPSSIGYNAGATWFSAAGDLMLRVGGTATPYIDLRATDLYDSSSLGKKFDLPLDQTIYLKGYVKNSGDTTCTNLKVNWTIFDPNGTAVYDDSITTTTALSRRVNRMYMAPSPYTLSDPGAYLVRMIAHNDSDFANGNDTTFLRINVGPEPRWFAYGNETMEGNMNIDSAWGFGIAFYPVSYTTAVESIRVAVSGDGVGELHIGINSATGLPSTTYAWSDNAANLTDGWNTIAIDPPVLVYTGQSFTVTYVGPNADNPGLSQDLDKPTAAVSTHSVAVTYQYQEGAYTVQTSGNWGIEAFLDTSSAVTPNPDIALFPSDTVRFGSVDSAGTTTLPLKIYNRGGRDTLRVTRATITSSVSTNFSITPNPTTSLPIKVAYGDSTTVTVTFHPTRTGVFAGSLTLQSNTPAPHNNMSVGLQGLGVITAVDDPNNMLPEHFALSQNFPNPFNPTTEINYSLPVASHVRLTVYNVLGEEMAVLANGMTPAGVHAVTFDASKLPSGMYFYRMEAGSFTAIHKMLLMK